MGGFEQCQSCRPQHQETLDRQTASKRGSRRVAALYEDASLWMLETRQCRLFVLSYVEYPVQSGAFERLQEKGTETTQDELAFGGAYPLVHCYQSGGNRTADEIEVRQVEDNAWNIVRCHQPFAEAFDVRMFRRYPRHDVEKEDAIYDPHAAPQQIPTLRAWNINTRCMRLARQNRATRWAKRPGWRFGYGVHRNAPSWKGPGCRGVNRISRHRIRIVRNPRPPYI